MMEAETKQPVTNIQPSSVNKLHPLTATSSVCIRFADFLEISNNKSE
jgi:hypothetical protein